MSQHLPMQIYQFREYNHFMNTFSKLIFVTVTRSIMQHFVIDHNTRWRTKLALLRIVFRLRCVDARSLVFIS